MHTLLSLYKEMQVLSVFWANLVFLQEICKQSLASVVNTVKYDKKRSSDSFFIFYRRQEGTTQNGNQF